MKYLIFVFISILNYNYAIPSSSWFKQVFEFSRFRAIDYTNNTTFYFYASNKKLYKSTNAGINWNINDIIIPGSGPGLLDGHYLNDYTGCLDLGRFYFTTNDGLIWTSGSPPQSQSGSNLDFHDLVVTNDSTILVCGYELIIDDQSLEGVIFKSTNRAQNWTKVGSVDFEAWSIKFADANTGFCISSNSISKTINGGSSWTYIGSIGGNQFKVLSNIKTDSFYIGCATGRIVKCTNSGTAYNVVQTPVTTPINDVAFIDNNIAFAVGNNGVILKTTNGGTSWFQQTSGTSANLNALAFANKDTIIAVGDSGVVLRTFTGGLTSITNGTEQLLGYTLEQNYPNPFNPVTSISFSIPLKTRVSLIVTDLNGKEVSKLIQDEELNSGSHSYLFSSEELPSGIYFYKLITKEFTQTKKMVLLK